MHRVLLLVLALAFAGSASLGGQTTGSSVAVTNVTVIPMDRERALPDHTVLIHKERIVEVGPSSRVKVPSGATLVDGRGKFLMPGVGEMHAHIPGGNAPNAYVEQVLKLFVANGVTTIRGMLGDPRHLPLRDRVAKGEVIGPTIVTSGPSFNGNSVTSAEAGVKMVQDQKAAGYDLLKIHPGVPRAAFDAVAAEADRLGIQFAGHVPADVGLERALAAKYRSIDHIDGYFEYAVKADAPVDRGAPGFFGANFAAHVDEARLKKAVVDTKAAGVWIVPTQGLLDIFMSADTPDEMRKKPGVEYMPAQIVEGWVKQRTAFLAQPDFSAARNERFLTERRKLLKALHDAGVDVAMGSDAVQTFSVPGFSIHNEMVAMARAGLTPYQIYVTGTRNVARFLGRDKDVGTVENGKIADLVLVDADPLADVANFARQSGVIVRGRWFARDDLLRQLRPTDQP